MRLTCGLLLLATPALLAQPFVSAGGIVNAAAYQAPSSPGGAIAQGSVFTIFGANLGPPFPGNVASRFPVDTTLAGVSVRLVHQLGQTFAAIPLFVSATQINAILPSATPVGLVTVSVTFNGRTSNLEAFKVVKSSFGVFTRNSGGTGPAIAQNFVTPASLPLNAPAAPAMPGQTVILWGTGLGPVPGSDADPPNPANRSDPLEITLAGRPVQADYQGRSGCCAGVDQINLRIPADAPTGCAVPLLVRLQGGVFANFATISISSDGGPCSDAFNLPGRAGRWGDVNLFTDSATALFAESEPPARFPPAGSCTSTFSPTGRILSAGPVLNLNGSISLPGDPPGNHIRRNLSLGPGNFSIEAPGGPDIGAFRASLTVAPGFTWTTLTGSRAAGLTASWTGPADYVTLSSPRFVCTAVASSGSFTIPPAVLASLPAQAPLEVDGITQTTFTAPGLDAGLLRYHAATIRNVSLGEPLLAATPVRLPDGRSILAELALTGLEQERGLMQRTELAADRGMLFPFDRPQLLTFWMFGTLIPLDILWMDSGRRIVFLSANTPPCRSPDPSTCPVYGPRDPTQFVLELGAGQAARLGLRLGDRLDW